jgi:putative oxidoreductase
MDRYGPTVLRLMVGIIFIAHGAQHLFGIWGGQGLAGTAASFDSIGLSPGFPLAVAVGVIEFGGGLLLLAGALTPYVSLALIVVMLGAMWKVHLANGFFINWAMTPGVGHGVEFNLLLIAALLCLTLGGPGALSIDHRLERSAAADAAGRARLRSKF